MPSADVNDIRMCDEASVERDASPLALWHGASGASDAPGAGWTEPMSELARRLPAMHLEHRGHGRTNHPTGARRDEAIAADADFYHAPHQVQRTPPWIVMPQALDVRARQPEGAVNAGRP
jgi:hypothetical protein